MRAIYDNTNILFYYIALAEPKNQRSLEILIILRVPGCKYEKITRQESNIRFRSYFYGR